MDRPAMTAEEIAEYPTATVRVHCRFHGVCLYAGNTDPEGGAEAVFAAAGCPEGDASIEELEACPARPT